MPAVDGELGNPRRWPDSVSAVTPKNDGPLPGLLDFRRAPLGRFPTPLQREPRLEELLGIDEVWVKRDDLTGFGWGGNKVRTVEFLLGDALAQGASTIVMAAGPSSNFAVTMASAAIGAGLQVEQICYGNDPSNRPSALKANQQSGVDVLFTGSDDRGSMERVGAERVRTINEAGGTAYSIPRGGATAIGSLGFANAAAELADQLEKQNLSPAHIVMAVGSGGSIAGLIAGRAVLGSAWSLIGVSVSRPDREILADVIANAEAAGSLLGAAAVDTSRLTMVDGRGDGFGISRADETELALRIENSCGLLLDPVYTAKAARWLAKAELTGPVLFWHTGGTLGVVDRLANSPHISPTP